MTWNYQTIKRIAKEEGLRVKDLIALAPQNDAFYVGAPGEVAAAEWFTELWRRFGYGSNVHLRRVHYQAVSQSPPISKPNGKPYQNTLKDWGYLCKAGKYARYLELVSPKSFVDRRNPDAEIHARWDNEGGWNYQDPTPAYETTDNSDDWDLYTLPELPGLDNIGYEVLPALPGFEVSGYDEGIQQDYHLEIWIEKTTMNDVIIPLCRKYNVNLVTGAGEMSITSVVDFLARVRESQRPARILYISDYDPAGLGMPISVARKIEFYQHQSDGEFDIRLLTVALTSEQVSEYSLPRVPVKDTDKRKGNWERDHGRGQVELDALEALYPGDLAVIVETTILGYYDVDLVYNARNERERLQADLDEIRDIAQLGHQEDIDTLNSDYQALRNDFEETRQRFSAMAQELVPEVESYQARLEEIVGRGRELYVDLHGEMEEDGDLDTGDYPLPAPDLPEESDALLYASERDYMDQLLVYQAYRHNE